MRKAAIVIGVNTTGDLPVLNAAASAATRVGSWLRRENFEVKRFIDTRRPVIASDLFATIAKLVDQGTLEQLVIYFSGHGFLNNGSEHWMLSGAPDNPNEAVSMAESTELARRCGIPNVVFISDACRSVPQTLRADRVRGSLIFPNPATTGNVDVELDRFFAALPGDPALELPLTDRAGQFEGIYTSCFLSAFRRPDEDMVRSVTVDGATIRVVPNRDLKGFLKREVNRMAQAKSIKLHQLPESRIESGYDCYLGRVAMRRGRAAARPVISRDPVDSVSDVASKRLSGFSVRGDGLLPVSNYGPERTATAIESKFNASVGAVWRADEFAELERGTGVVVDGVELQWAGAVGMAVDLLNSAAADGPTLVRLHPDPHRVGSLILRFADGGGTILAAIKGYIASVVVDDGRVVNVSYVPSADNRWLREDYDEQYRLKELRANVASATRFGVFEMERSRAGVVASKIRYMKRIDPTLGLYAAYAFADAGLQNEIASVRAHMQDDLDADLFDVAMLADGSPAYRGPVVPICPMLSQGWGLLRVKPMPMIEAASRAANHLRPALWTTFEPAGMDILEEAYHRGVLT